jgi:energy-coupling factor transporter ATP-binding protein EcfA2
MTVKLLAQMVMEATSGFSNSLERVGWESAVAHMAWQQGEHITLIGPTGSGKTELIIALLRHHRWVLFLSTKRIDKTIIPLKTMGYKTIHSSNELNPEIHSRFIIAPKWQRKLDPVKQSAFHKKVFSDTLTRAFWQTGWTVAIDELEYINRDLQITVPVNLLLRQGRSQGNSLIVGTQRPRHVTLHAYEQADHIFIWKQGDASNVERAAEFTDLSKREVMRISSTLGKHDVLYVKKETGDMFITNTRWEG